MNYRNYSQSNLAKQKGVVLITSLIFLILILMLVRFSLSESQLQERKSGIDFDIARATEAAEVALRIAEEDILSRQTTGFSLKKCDGLIGPAATRCIEAREALRVLDVISFWRGNNSLKYVVYGDNLPCNPIWQCTAWGSHYRGHMGDKVQSAELGKDVYVENMNLSKGQKLISPRYVIESFNPVSNLDLGTYDPATEDSVILRVTALGFGLDDGAGTVTNAMLQSTYILKP